MDTEIAIADYRLMPPRPRSPKRQIPEPKLYVGEWIAALGLMPRKVANEAPINEGYLSNIISNKKTPTKKLAVIAAYLGIPIQKLYEPPPSRDVLRTARDLDPDVLRRLRQKR